jgi:hypothetical protein
MILLSMPITAIVLLIYWGRAAYKSAQARAESDALRVAAARATDRQQWESLDY